MIVNVQGTRERWTGFTSQSGVFSVGTTFEDAQFGWATVADMRREYGQFPAQWPAPQTPELIGATITCRPATAEEIARELDREAQQERQAAEWRAGARERFWLATFGDVPPFRALGDA